MDLCSSSTPADELQQALVRREAERARWAAVNARGRLVATGRESAAEHGRVLFERSAEQVSVALGLLLEDLLENPGRAGRNLSCWPLLLLVGRGPRSLALVALTAVIDRISAVRPEAEVAREIGRAIEAEVLALRTEARGQAMVRLLRRRLGPGRLSDPRVLRALRLDPGRWEAAQRREIGLLLLGVIASSTDLLQLRQLPGRRARVVEPSEVARAIIRGAPPRPVSPRQLALLVRPIEWTGMSGGGWAGNTEPLVRCRAGSDLSYLDPPALAPVLAAVNALQGQQLEVDAWMVEQQRQAWDRCVPGLFSVAREPTPLPDPPAPGSTTRQWADFHEARRAHARMLRDGAPQRRRIEESLAMRQQLAGRRIWLAYCADFRGRIYTANRQVTHQGPDHEKAGLLFGQGRACTPDGFEWLLRGAAGHWGIRGDWEERLRWGRENLGLMAAAAEAPLERLNLWRGASDPWQFLQACRAVQQQLAAPGSECRTPVRFDQTCSGIGIAAALTRDARLGLETNLIGSSRGDIYATVANRLVEELQLDLHTGLPREVAMAEFWLKLHVDRAIVKGPVMTSCYGSQHLGVTEQLIELLEERDNGLTVGQWQAGYVAPAQFLATRLRPLLARELASCLALRSWLVGVTRDVVRTGRRLRWTGPSGFPVELGAQFDPRRATATVTRGRRRWRTVSDAEGEAGLSARQTRAIAANFIHSFDAAFCHAVICRAAAHGVALLTNHDCFAAVPADAAWLHGTLHDALRATYAPDWLAVITAEIRCANTGVSVPAPPMATTLDPARIGENPLCFS